MILKFIIVRVRNHVIFMILQSQEAYVSNLTCAFFFPGVFITLTPC